MFAGIVQGLCEVVQIHQAADALKLEVNLQDLGDDLDTGASVAVNGVCLTVTHLVGAVAGFDVIRQSQQCTNLAALKSGAWVNIERSMRLQDEIGGHIVSGHVCACVEVVTAFQDQEPKERCWLACPDSEIKYIFDKGFVTLDGASLTVSAVQRKALQFAVDLIPETRVRTTLGRLQAGDLLNLEIDQQTRSIVETIERLATDGALKLQ